MQGNLKIIEGLNRIIAAEWQGIHQYTQHRALAAVWGYEKFVEYLDKRIKDETHHKDETYERVIVLGGKPVGEPFGPVSVAADLPGALANDRKLEVEAKVLYDEVVALCVELHDEGTRIILSEHAGDEDRHLREIEAYMVQIRQMTPANWLSTQA